MIGCGLEDSGSRQSRLSRRKRTLVTAAVFTERLADRILIGFGAVRSHFDFFGSTAAVMVVVDAVFNIAFDAANTILIGSLCGHDNLTSFFDWK